MNLLYSEVTCGSMQSYNPNVIYIGGSVALLVNSGYLQNNAIKKSLLISPTGSISNGFQKDIFQLKRLYQACPNYSIMASCACRFLFEPIKSRHDSTNQLSEDWDQLIKWVEPGVILFGWNEKPAAKWTLYGAVWTPLVYIMPIFSNKCHCFTLHPCGRFIKVSLCKA